MTLKEPIGPRASLTGEVLERVLNAILAGEMKPGEVIREAVVARQLGISRGPLREALNRLEGRQLVERVSGTVRVKRLSAHDLIHLFEIRAVLEGLACRRAAELMSDEELDELETMVHGSARLRQTDAGGRTYGQDDDFHHGIVRASRSERLIKLLWEDLYYPVRIYRMQSTRSSTRVKAAWQEHRKIMDALRARDPERAEQAMRAHIESAKAFLVTSISGGDPALPAEEGVRIA